eukprot:1155152-Pelagomonas_calceolata.AAC.8
MHAEYIWNVGFYNLAGAQEDASEFYSHQLEKATVEVLNAMCALPACGRQVLAIVRNAQGLKARSIAYKACAAGRDAC